MITTLLFTLAGAFAIEGARVEVGDGSVLERATVVVGDDGRLVEVGPSAKVPAGARRIDGKGMTVTPGLIETEAQLGLMEVGLEATTNDHAIPDNPIRPGFRAADGYNPSTVRIPIEREEGVTSAVTSPTQGLLSGTGAWIDLSGKPGAVPDPERPVAMFGSVAQGAVDVVGQSRGALWLRLREILDDVRFYKKNRAAYDKGDARSLSLSRVHLEALIPVVDGKLPLVLTANRASDILAALGLKEREQIDVIIRGGAEAWVVAGALAKAKVPVILCPSTQEPSGFEALRARDDAAALLDEAGVTVVITAAGWDQNARRLRQEAGIATAHGMKRDAALRAITLSPALVFGKGKELGSLAKGKRANLVVWDGDPLELSTTARHVFIDGEELPLDNRQRQLAKKYLQ